MICVQIKRLTPEGEKVAKSGPHIHTNNIYHLIYRLYTDYDSRPKGLVQTFSNPNFVVFLRVLIFGKERINLSRKNLPNCENV